MKRQILSALVGCAILALSAASARAGLLTIITDLPTEYAQPNVDLCELSISGPASQVAEYNLYLKMDSDPRFNVWASLTNDSGSPWDSFSVTITPADGFTLENLTPKPVPTSMGYDDYLPVATVDVATNTITYSGGIVPVGAELQVLYYFDIMTGNTPQFLTTTSYHIAVGSAPEPASLALLGIGAALLLRRRR
jgi:hypothetical protein